MFNSNTKRRDQDSVLSLVMNVGKRASAKVYIDSSAVITNEEATPIVSASLNALAPSPKTTRMRLTQRLSHDISTEQLFSDQLIDGKVADGEDDEDEEEENNDHANAGDATASPTPATEPKRGRYREAAHKKQPRSGHHKSSSHNHSHSHSSSKTKTSLLAVHAEVEAVTPSHTMYRIESHSHLSSLEAKHLDSSSTISGGAAPTTPGKASNRIALLPLSDTTTACAKCLSNKEMPPLHSAAYAGHDTCLTVLLDAKPCETETSATTTASATIDEVSLTRPSYLDKKRRTPLFYACAANRLECCALLLRQRIAWRDLADKQLDTPVHVCCFFGWHACLECLLTAGADPHGRNAKGFKPSHIAKTRECLELLRSYGDDLQQGDKLGRTPLFVACARDRANCVEFLCSWNHETRSWMLEQEDQRGDRPIHAAACNGSSDSLEILLRYGADPSIQNANNMTPRDLASANHHVRCVELLAAAEHERASANAWFAPANAAGFSQNTGENSNNCAMELSSAADAEGWIECWDSASAQPFYYHNLSGKCQWEVPDGFQPQLLELLHTTHHHQNQQHEEDENGDYVWVKKKRQTVCVVTHKESEWTAVQDPSSKAIYYKNTRTGQSQWEEPDAVQQLQSASAAQAAQHATQIWDELERSRTALAKALAADKQRQRLAQQTRVKAYKLEIQRRRDDMRKKEEQAKLQQLLPRSSFIRRKKQSMMIKIHGASANNCDDDDKMERICQREPSLDIFLSTYVRVQGVSDLQLSLAPRFFNCLFHYYVALVDPVERTGLSKSQFRTVLRDAGILPSASIGHASRTATLPLHVVDLIFAQAARVEALAASQPRSLHATASFVNTASPLIHSPQHRQGNGAASVSDSQGQSQLGVVGFVAAMQIVRERVVTLAEAQSEEENEQQPLEIDDDDQWFLTTYVLPLTVRLGGKLLTQIRECKELELDVQASEAVRHLLTQNRQAIQRLHRYYTHHELNKQLKMLSFRGLSQFVLDFCIAPQSLPLPTLYQLYEAINWISGHAHTDVISFEKFQQLLTVLAVHTVGGTNGPLATGDGGKLSDERDAFLVTTITTFFRRLETCPVIHRVATATAAPEAATEGGHTVPGSTSTVKAFFHLG